MALRWRIRHKLLIGLGVVAGIIAFLVLGTLQGLAAFTDTIKTADNKIVELHLAEDLQRAVAAMIESPNGNSKAHETIEEEDTRLHAQITAARQALSAYVARIQASGTHHPDADNGDHQAHLLKDLQSAFTALDEAIVAFRKPSFMVNGEGGGLLQSAPVTSILKRLNDLATELRTNVAEELFDRIAAARKEHRRSLTVVLTTSVLGIVLMAGLLRFFFNWVFHPIRDLQAGVARVARGDFSQPIVLNSQDELQELAAAFNDMTGKLRATYDELSSQVHERGKQLVIAPADGKIVQIAEVDEPAFLQSKSVRVSIFMNVFNVHVNRYPVSGTVQYVHYNKGKFINAAADKASLENEQSSVGIETESNRILVRQIAGLIARRIVTYSKVGEKVNQGDRMGIIRFGSRVDVFLPLGAKLRVAVGQTTVAGVTVLGELPLR